MYAYRFHNANEDLVLSKITIPEPSNEQALINVEVAGLCHSDIHVLKSRGAAWMCALPVILGHEIAGTIIKIGRSKTNSYAAPFKLGDRVAIACVGHPIETRVFQEAPGVGYDGGYAEYVVAYIKNLVKIPEGVSFAQAAVATDSMSTAYHAIVTEGNISESVKVAIIGLGGLGLNGVAIATSLGAKVYGVDINISKYEQATSLGAVECASTLDQLENQYFDVIVDFAGAQATVQAAMLAVKLGGTIVLVGLASENITFSIASLVTKNISLKGSTGAGIEELDKVLALIASRVLQPRIQEIPFHDIPRGLELLNSNEANGRLYAVSSAGKII